MSDIMDEFEFKPLTEGLGFHKKPSEKIAKKDSLALATPQTPLSKPLPRKDLESTLTTEMPSTTVDEILKSLNKKKRPDFDSPEVRLPKTHLDKRADLPTYKASGWSFSSFLLDAMLVVAMNLACLIILLITTKIDLFANLFNPDTNSAIYLSLLALIGSTTWIYLVATRIFLGATPGEWVFDQRLGLPQELGSAMHSLLAMSRATLVVCSGLILFPVVSMMLNRDVLGRFIGLELMKKN